MLKVLKNKKTISRMMAAVGILLVIGASVYFYFATLTYENTANVKAEYTVEAIPFIKEFEQNNKTANKKYSEKIIAVHGIVTATLPADTTINIEMKDGTTGSYLIFDFQQQHLDKAKKIRVGETVTIKGSCSDGVYSEILGTYFISFKRCTLDE